MTANAQHSSASDRWYTPLPIVDTVRSVLGTIDLDPASDAFGNSRVVARKFYDQAQDGLVQPWSGTIFVNPPGGTRPDPLSTDTRGRSNAGLYWRKLMATHMAGHLTHAIFLCFSLELLERTQRPGLRSCCDFALCVPTGRVRYDRPDGEPGTQPTHASALVYVPGTTDKSHKFATVARKLGRLLLPGGDR